MSALEVRRVTFTRSRVLLDDIDLDFHPGEVTALSGPSGSGKTTLLSIAGGLVEPTQGSATLGGRPMWQGTGDPRPEVAFVLQVYGLVPILSARENVSIALRARGVAPDEADERAEAALARFHIADLGDRQVEELSGGQMQRVACARGFVVGADVLLADEPTSELDEGNRGVVLAELRAEAERGAVVVVATHDPAVVAACDRHYALDEGRLILAESVADPDANAAEPEVEDEPEVEVEPEVEAAPEALPTLAPRHLAPAPAAAPPEPAPRDVPAVPEAERSPFARPLPEAGSDSARPS
ncbi:MAG: ATP-binding cassette domain-containing protein [Nocardioidaceae bacterium]|nr:ATP-binding cassette domain-containing protein [Nocardioidaceae bacterium]